MAGDLNAAALLLPLASRHPLTYNAHNVMGAYKTPDGRRRPLTDALVRAFERRLLGRARSPGWSASWI